MAGNLLRTRVDRAPFLSRWFVDLYRYCLHFHHRHHRGQNSRPRLHMWLFRSRQQKLEFHRSYRARFVSSRGADCALHLRAPTRTLVLTARLEPVCRDIFEFATGTGTFAEIISACFALFADQIADRDCTEIVSISLPKDCKIDGGDLRI